MFVANRQTLSRGRYPENPAQLPGGLPSPSTSPLLSTPTPPSEMPTRTISTVPPRPNRLVLGRPEAPDVVIQRLPSAIEPQLARIEARQETLSQLSAFLQQAPALAATSATAMSSDLYLMSFSPAVAQGLATGNYDLARSAEGGFRAYAMGPDGVVGQGSLHAIDGVQAVAATLAVWQVLSIITAQYHLHKINTQLQTLAQGIAAIRQWLENSRRGRLHGKHSYLNGLFEDVAGQRLTPQDVSTHRHQLETVEREVLEELHAIDADLRDFVASVPQTPMTNRFGTERDVVAIEQRMDELSDLLQQRQLALRVRGVAVQILGALPGTQHIANARITRISDDLKSPDHVSDAEPALRSLIETKIQSKLKSGEASLNRAHLVERLDSLQLATRHVTTEMNVGLVEIQQTVQQQLVEQERPLRLAARLGSDGQILELMKLEARAHGTAIQEPDCQPVATFHKRATT